MLRTKTVRHLLALAIFDLYKKQKLTKPSILINHSRTHFQFTNVHSFYPNTYCFRMALHIDESNTTRTGE